MDKNSEKEVNDAKTVLCRYEDGVYEIPVRVFLQMAARTQDPSKKYVRYKEGAYMYSMSEREFFKLAHDANAVCKRNQMTLVDTEILDKFMEFYH